MVDNAKKRAEESETLASGLSALINDWLKVKSAARNPSRLSTRTGIGPKRLKSLIDGESEPTISETMGILNVVHPGAPHEHKRFLLEHCKCLPWAADEIPENEQKEAFCSMDFESQQKFLRQKISAAVDSVQKTLDEHEKHAGYLVEDLVERLMKIEAVQDQFLSMNADMSKRYKTIGERRVRSAFRTERRKRFMLEEEIAKLRKKNS